MANSCHIAPSLRDLEELAAAALKTIPEELISRVENLAIRVEDFPDGKTIAEMGLEGPFDLMGLYHGVSLDRRSVGDSGVEPDLVFLYRRPILDYWCETGEPLADIVRHVLIHEIGHYFGFSDEDMERIEAET